MNHFSGGCIRPESPGSIGFLILLVCLLPLLFGSPAAHAADTLVLHDGVDYYQLGKYVEFLEDRSGTLTIDEVVSPAVAKRFVPNDKEPPNFGVCDTVYWIRFRIADQSTMARDWLLEQQYPLMRTFDLYLPKGNGSFEVKRFGDNSARADKVLSHRNPLYKIQPSRQGDTCYIRASVGSLTVFPLVIHASDEFLKQEALQLLGYGLFFGIMLAMALYNLYLFIFLRDRIYLYYVLYVILFIILQMSLHGFLRQYLFPYESLHDNYVFRILVFSTVLASLVFSRRYLKSNIHAPSMDRLLCVLIAIDILMIPLDLFLPLLPSLQLMDLNALVAPVLATATGLVCYFRGYKPALYYLIARAFLYISVCVFVIDNTIARNYNFFTWYAMMPGSLLDVVILSLGLADRINIMRREKEKAEADVIRTGSRALIGEMAAGVAHEVNNPLAGVMLCFQGVVRSREGDPEREELIKAVEGGLVKIQSTVAHLLNFSRMTATEIRRADIGVLIGNVLMLCRYQLENANIQVVTRLADDLPDQPLDENRMGQVLVNLLLNASHAMQEGGVLTISTVRDANWCVLSVKDTGKGISPEHLPRIFEPFFTTKEGDKGTGLGLSISKSIVDSHGGFIEMESLYGSGSTCRIRLPLEV